MHYRFRLTSSAARELEHEIAYSAAHWGRKHASAYRLGLMVIIKHIAAHPFATPERPELGAGYRLVRYKGNYIVYCVNEAESMVEIMAFPSVHRLLMH
jgi:plasmid stabilization system protein ParE